MNLVTKMSNEVYHVLRASILAAEYGLDAGVVIILKKGSGGKTHTVRMLERDYSPQVTRMIPGTPTALYDFLIDSHPYVYYLDDRDKWAKEFLTGLRYIKLMTDGEKAPLKMTRYNKETVFNPIPSNAWCWMFVNEKQYDASSPFLDSTGLNPRAIFLRSQHEKSTLEYIEGEYEANGWGDNNLPYLTYHEDWFIENKNKIRVLTKNEDEFIEKNFKDTKRRYIRRIAKVMTETGFKAVSKLLLESESGKYYTERIDFDPNRKEG